MSQSNAASASAESTRPPRIIRTLLDEVRTDDLNGLAAELSYRLFVTIVPLLTFLASLGALAASELGGENPARTIVEAAGDTLSSSAASSIESELSQIISSSGVSTLIIGIVGSLWTGGLAMGTVVKALDRIHDSDHIRPRIRRLLVTALLTVVTGVLLVAATVGIVLTGAFHDTVTDWFGIDSLPRVLVAAVGWLLAFVLVVAAASFLYWAAPSRHGKLRVVSLGGIGFATIWVVGSIVFAFYVANFSSYASTYGVLGAVILALGWIYFSCMAFFIGAELDLVLHRRREH